MCAWFCTRRDGAPLRESSWLSPGKRIMTTGLRWCLSARNIASPCPIGVRQSSSLWMIISGVVMAAANVTGERSRYSCGSS